MKPVAIAERKRAEEALRESEKSLREAQYLAHIGSWRWTIATDTVKWSEELYHINGRDPNLPAPSYAEMSSCYTPESWKRLSAVVAKAFQSGESYELDLEMVRPDGTTRDTSARGQVVYDASSKIVGLHGTVQDITEQKRAEQNQVRLVAMLNGTPGFVGFADAKDTHILYINPAGRKMVGIQAQDDVTQLKIADVHPEWTNKLFRDEIIPTAIRDGMWTGECAFLNRDGHEISVMMTLLAHKSSSGEVERFSTISIDITERKRAEEALRESEERYRTLIENVGEGIGFVNHEEQFAFANAAAEDIFGVPPSGLLGRSLHEFSRPEQFGMIREQTDRRRAGEKSVYEIEINRPNGEKRNLLITAVPQFGGQGQFMGTLGVFRDITERKRADEALQASLREKEILLREIHHRVKNNMQIISSLFNLQSGHIKDEDARRMLKEGQLRIRSMALVHEKLYQSRDLSKIDFADYLRSLSEHLFAFFGVEADRIRLETDLEDVPLDVNSAVPCGLLVTELITNALKHAFPGDRKGAVGVRLHQGEDGIVELRVSDDGVGFPEAADFRHTESLGLQIVSLLVGQLEGTIELDRKKGTVFTIAFRNLSTG